MSRRMAECSFVAVAGLIAVGGCASHEKRSSNMDAMLRDYQEHQAYLTYLESQFVCIYDGPGGVPPSKVRGDEPLTTDELNMMAVVYRKLVMGCLFWHEFSSCNPVPPTMMVSVSGWFGSGTAPPQPFLETISTTAIRAIAPGRLEHGVPICRLKLLSWLSPDSVYVNAFVSSFGGGTMRSALAVRDGNDWRVCPAPTIGFLCGLRVQRSSPPRPIDLSEPDRQRRS